MAENVLKGIIQITAPGSQQVFNGLSNDVKKTEATLKGFNNSSNITDSTLQSLASNIKTGSNQFKILGEAGQLTGSKLGALTGVFKTTASNIPPIISASNSAVSSFAGLAKSALGLIGALTGAHIVGRILGEVFRSVVNNILEASNSFSDGEIAAAKFQIALENITKAANDLKENLDFKSEIAKLNAQIAGLKGEDLQIFDEKRTREDAIKIITFEQNVTDALVKQKKAAEEGFAKITAVGTASKKLQQIALNFSNLKLVPKSLIEDLPKREQTLLNSYIEVLNKIDESKRRSSKAQEDIGKSFSKIQVDENQKKDRLDKEALAAYEKFVNDTISKAKKLSSAFKDVIDISPGFSVLDTKEDELRKSLSFLDKFDKRQFKFKVLFQPDLQAVPPDEQSKARTEDEINQILQSVSDFKPEPVTIDFSIAQAITITGAAEKFGNDFADIFRKSVQENLAKGLNLDDALAAATSKVDQLKGAVESFNSILGNLKLDTVSSFAEGIGNILGGGDLKNVFKDFGEIVGSGLVALGKQLLIVGGLAEATQAALKSLFTPQGAALAIATGVGLIIAGSALKSALSKGVSTHRASGGLVQAGRLFEVNEKGKEFFIPDTGGRIVPNSAFTGGGSGSGGVRIYGEFLLAGNNLVASIANTTRSQNRLS